MKNEQNDDGPYRSITGCSLREHRIRNLQAVDISAYSCDTFTSNMLPLTLIGEEDAAE